MATVRCPFCGNEHDTKVMDLTAHYAPYLQGLGMLPNNLNPTGEKSILNPMMVQQGMKALRNATGNPLFTVKMSDLTDGWTGGE